MHKKLLLILANAILFLSAADASPLDILGAGARAAGMGNVGASIGESAFASALNPATLTRGEWPFAIEVGYVYTSSDLEISLDAASPFGGRADLVERAIRQRENAQAPEGINGYSIGMAGHLGSFGIGLTAYLPQHRYMRYQITDVDQPYFLDYGNRGQVLHLQPAFAFKVWEELSFGVAATILGETSGSVATTVPMGAGERVEASGNLSTGEAVFFSAGVSYTFIDANRGEDRWGIGASFDDKQVLEHAFTQRLTTVNNGEAFSMPVALRTFSHFQPRQVRIGFHYNIKNEGISLAFDLVWRQWSKYKPPYPTISIEYPDAIAPSDRPRIYNPEDLEILEFWDFKDTFVPHLGFQYAIDQSWAVRFGYAWEQNPVPQQTGVTNILAADTHTVSFGASYQRDAGLQIDFFSLYRQLADTETIKDPAQLPNQSGTADFETYNAGFPVISVEGAFYAAGISFSFR